MTEKDLIIKYVPSYANTNNPSSWTAVSDFDAFEILNNPEHVYGLSDQQRLEVSNLIHLMVKLTQATNTVVTLTKGITVHMLYEQTKKTVALADKKI